MPKFLLDPVKLYLVIDLTAVLGERFPGNWDPIAITSANAYLKEI
jgi:hypothetical protein